MKLRLFGAAGSLVLAVVVVVSILLHRSGGETPQSSFRGTVEPPGLTLPSFTLRDQRGRLVRSGDFRGKVVVLTLLETKCRTACPIIAGEVAATWKLLTPSERAQAAAVAISADPRDDTRASVRAFLERHRAAGVIRYLVGSVTSVRRVWRRLQVLSSLDSGNADTHSAPVRIYSRDLVWLATEHVGVDLSARNLAHDIRAALGRRSS